MAIVRPQRDRTLNGATSHEPEGSSVTLHRRKYECCIRQHQNVSNMCMHVPRRWTAVSLLG